MTLSTHTDSKDDYDSPWKDAIEHYLPEFLQFFFPSVFAQINWALGFDFLDQELHAIARDAESGKRYVDKLARVRLLNGKEQWVYIHIEVQSTYDARFGQRVFRYNYRIYDRFDQAVASLVVLADDRPHWKPSRYHYKAFGGCVTGIRFMVAKLLDYRDRLDELLDSDNVFALITAAHLLTRQTRKDNQARYQAKRKLVRLLYERNWERQRILDLFGLIDWMMKLPAELSQQLWYEIETIEEQHNMRYVTSIERLATQRGFDKGRLEGWEQGRTEGRTEGRMEGRMEGKLEGQLEGRLEGEIKILKKQLERRFGALPVTVVTKLDQASEDQLESWSEAILTAVSLEVIFPGSTPH